MTRSSHLNLLRRMMLAAERNHRSVAKEYRMQMEKFMSDFMTPECTDGLDSTGLVQGSFSIAIL
jgi:hypothetical protein